MLSKRTLNKLCSIRLDPNVDRLSREESTRIRFETCFQVFLPNFQKRCFAQVNAAL